MSAPPHSGSLTIVPDASGCIVCAATEPGLGLWFWGPTSRAVAVDNGADVSPLMVFVEFPPGGSGRILNISARSWRDVDVPLDTIEQ